MAHIGGLAAGFLWEYYCTGSVRVNVVPLCKTELNAIVP